MHEPTIESLVTFRTDRGEEVHGAVTRLGQHVVAFEVHGPEIVLRMSEVLAQFQITANDRVIYKGHAVIRDLVGTGGGQACEVSLSDPWIDLEALAETEPQRMREEFGRFVRGWQKVFTVESPLKLVPGP